VRDELVHGVAWPAPSDLGILGQRKWGRGAGDLCCNGEQGQEMA
jgi:hypothetical protein